MNYYRKPIEKTVDDVKLKMQIGALTLKLSVMIKLTIQLQLIKILRMIFYQIQRK